MIVSLCRDGGKTTARADILRRAIGGSQMLHYFSHRRERSMSVPPRDSKQPKSES
jgi:hypothetical protein